MKNSVTTSDSKRFIRRFVPLMVIFLIPFLMILISVSFLPSVYSDTFVGELGDKFHRLESINEKKIVVVGGSSVAFGLDSQMIEDELGYKAVNFGLYANLGTKLMMDLSLENINEGDIVILAPELNSQTLSLYFNSETAAQALDGNLNMLKAIDSEHYPALIGSSWQLAGNKLHSLISGELPENVGAYKKENFNEYGDNVYDRPFNEMNGFGNEIKLDFTADSDDYDEFIAYINEYTKKAEKAGAKVYYSFPPINEQAIMGSNSEEDIISYYKNLCTSLDCKVISDIFDYIMDEGYFYDSEFHLNNSGVIVRTVRLIDDIKRELSRDDITLEPGALPSPAGHKPYCEDFELRKLDSGRGWAVSGLTDAGKKKKYVTIPDEINSLPVTHLLSGALSGNSEVLLCTLGKNITVIESGAIANSPLLEGIILQEGANIEALSLPENGIGNGCADGFKVYVNSADYKRALSAENLASVAEIIALNESFDYEIVTVAGKDEAKLVSLSETCKFRSELTIPNEYNGVPITTIASGAFSDCEVLDKLTLGRNVSTVETGAFGNADHVILISIPEGVSPDDLDLPSSPSDLGTNMIKINVGWQEYYMYLANDRYANYKDILTTDNPYLLLEKSQDGSWRVVGINETGKTLSELVIPDSASGSPITNICAEAFADSSITTLTLGENISRIDGRAFYGSSLKTVIIPDDKSPDDISVPNSMSEYLATDGCKNGLEILVAEDKYTLFISDYFWGDYGRYLVSK